MDPNVGGVVLRVHNNPHRLMHGIWVSQVLGSGDNSNHGRLHAVDDDVITADSVRLLEDSSRWGIAKLTVRGSEPR